MATNNSLAQVYPNQGLGFLVLGASLHDVLVYLKARPQTFPNISISHSSSQPIHSPIILDLPSSGVRIRFDGLDQRLRLVEVLDFTKGKLIYKNTDIVRGPSDPAAPSSTDTAGSGGPTFRHVYHRLFGPTFPGEYVPPDVKEDGAKGTYVLSYPGIAFSFPLHDASWSPDVDFVSLLSSNAASPALSMAIFNGSSWSDARRDLYTRSPPNPRSLSSSGRHKDLAADEVEVVKIRGAGRLELIRRSSPSFWITLSETTPQDLVAELGPPDAIYRKHDQRLAIHRPSAFEEERSQMPAGIVSSGLDDLTDTDQSSSHGGTDESEDETGVLSRHDQGSPGTECFYNYFHHGFDVLISHPTTLSPLPPRPPNQKLSNASDPAASRVTPATTNPTATKVLLHGNIPGSYPFNRHRRIRWELGYDSSSSNASTINSDMPFKKSSALLKEVWKHSYASQDEERQLQRGMVLNRGWGDSPSSSCELLGGWEEGLEGKRKGVGGSSVDGELGLGNTELFGFPGLVFEVLKNDAVSCLTIF
ncbi:MAG: hypothetical protein M1837_001119 [Sclerophora amabilis]|nr:MAG: hypothetical protein M1837_001119 [Sclerophora amabilis]